MLCIASVDIGLCPNLTIHMVCFRSYTHEEDGTAYGTRSDELHDPTAQEDQLRKSLNILCMLYPNIVIQ